MIFEFWDDFCLGFLQALVDLFAVTLLKEVLTCLLTKIVQILLVDATRVNWIVVLQFVLQQRLEYLCEG